MVFIPGSGLKLMTFEKLQLKYVELRLFFTQPWSSGSTWKGEIHTFWGGEWGGGGLGRLHRPRGFVFLFFFFLTPAQEPARNVCLSQLDVILTCALAHCFQHPKPLQLMSCSFSIMFLLFRTEGCYFCTYIHQVFFFFFFSLSSSCFDNTNTLCHWDGSITAGHLSASYSRPGGSFIFQDKCSGRFDNV